MRLQLNRLRAKASWLLVMATLCRTPVISFVKKLGVAVFGTTPKPLVFKSLAPAVVGVSSMHSLSGATTYVTSTSPNQLQGSSGDAFSFAFMTGGNYKAFSYTVSGLPSGLSYNGNVDGPMITGSLPSAGSYPITIIGHRYSGQQGNQTPPYNLLLTVTETQQESEAGHSESTSSEDGVGSNENSESNSSSSIWTDDNTQSLDAGWSRSSWFGDFYGKDQGWIYHLTHGWLYLQGTDESGFWVHDETFGWLYTGKDVYPFFYRDSTSTWLYDQSSSSERKFWDYASNQAITPPKKI